MECNGVRRGSWGEGRSASAAADAATGGRRHGNVEPTAESARNTEPVQPADRGQGRNGGQLPQTEQQ